MVIFHPQMAPGGRSKPFVVFSHHKEKKFSLMTDWKCLSELQTRGVVVAASSLEDFIRHHPLIR